MPQGVVGVVVVDAEQEAEHDGGDDELHELLPKHRSDGAACPLHVFLVGNEAADEEEEDKEEVS